MNDLHQIYSIISDSYHNSISDENRVILHKFYTQWLPISHLCMPYGIGKNKLMVSVHNEVKNGLVVTVDQYHKLITITENINALCIGIDGNIPLTILEKTIHTNEVLISLEEESLNTQIKMLKNECINTELCESVINAIIRHVNKQKLLGET